MSFPAISQVGCQAPGVNAIALGLNCYAPGDQSIALGNGCTSSGLYAFTMGNNCTADGQASAAVGDTNSVGANSANTSVFGSGNTTTGVTPDSFVAGTGNTVSDAANPGSAGSQASVGDGNLCSNFASFAWGKDNVSSGDTSFCYGTTNQATNNETFAYGSGCLASGVNAMARGLNCQATADRSLARGVAAKATIIGADSYSSQQTATWAVGAAQTSVVTLTGSTPGAGAGESVELAGGSVTLVLPDNHGCMIRVSCVATGTNAGVPEYVRTFSQDFAVRRISGTTVIAASGTQVGLGDAAAVSWTLAGSIGLGPDRFVLTFTTGATTHEARVMARVEITDVFFA